MKKHMTAVRLSLALALALHAHGLAAEPMQSLAEIREAATVFLGNQLTPIQGERQSVLAGALDPRLHLVLCTEPLKAGLAPGSVLAGTTTIAVSCAQPKTWTVYVPVRIARYSSVVTSRQTLARGTRLAAGDVEIREADTNNVRGQGYGSADAVVGSMLKRAVGPQQVLTEYDICLICKGESVTIVARTANLLVKMPGLALSDGTRGQTISVRNRDSKRLVEATVTAAGVVEIAL